MLQHALFFAGIARDDTMRKMLHKPRVWVHFIELTLTFLCCTIYEFVLEKLTEFTSLRFHAMGFKCFNQCIPNKPGNYNCEDALSLQNL